MVVVLVQRNTAIIKKSSTEHQLPKRNRMGVVLSLGFLGEKCPARPIASEPQLPP
jgi:hypothetical protein